MTDDGPERLDVVEARLDQQRDGLESLWSEIDDLRDELEKEREERRRLEAENEELREQLSRIDARTDMLRLVEDIDDMTGKQRSLALIQHLRRAAEKEESLDRSPKSSVNRSEAERALQHPDVDRTTIYDDMRRAARLVGDEDVLWYDTSGKESRLRLDLTAGEIPESVASRAAVHGGG